MIDFNELYKKAKWVRKETLKLHKRAPGTRLASSLSDVEIFVVLYYGGILKYNPKDIYSEDRTRFIISKGHGAISIYPILADLKFYNMSELDKISTEESFMANIPDTMVPGFETINGSVGHGLGVAVGVALALKRKRNKVFVLCGDGELNEGSVWEAIMFAGFHKLGNLILIIDNNKLSMLGYQKDILGLEPLEEKFKVFNWKTTRVNGHDIKALYNQIIKFERDRENKPKVIIADTIKGKGVPSLEKDKLSHVRILSSDEVDSILKKFYGE